MNQINFWKAATTAEKKRKPSDTTHWEYQEKKWQKQRNSHTCERRRKHKYWLSQYILDYYTLLLHTFHFINERSRKIPRHNAIYYESELAYKLCIAFKDILFKSLLLALYVDHMYVWWRIANS